MTTSIITSFLESKLITNIIGTIPNSKIQPALVVWARKDPKYQFRALVALAQAITSHPLTVYVDDVCSQTIMGRTFREQEIFNNKYIEFFCELGCTVKLSSAIYKTCHSMSQMSFLMDIGHRISVAEFMRCLPEAKRLNLDHLYLGEIMHLLLELMLFEFVGKESNLLIVGHFSQAIIASHRNISNNPLTAIVTPKFKDRSEVNVYIATIKTLRGKS